jgi:hypothetical protein
MLFQSFRVERLVIKKACDKLQSRDSVAGISLRGVAILCACTRFV